ncbi:hypothetical protein M758_12G053900 [Ceratodon purpureus]|nr:hypothetical protein M758_12G053900 [Ceratodon purpureus]
MPSINHNEHTLIETVGYTQLQNITNPQSFAQETRCKQTLPLPVLQFTKTYSSLKKSKHKKTSKLQHDLQVERNRPNNTFSNNHNSLNSSILSKTRTVKRGPLHTRPTPRALPKRPRNLPNGSKLHKLETQPDLRLEQRLKQCGKRIPHAETEKKQDRNYRARNVIKHATTTRPH